MKQRGITPRQLQILLDFPYVQTVYNWYQGKNMPTIDNLVVLAQILGVTMDDIVVTRMVEMEIDDVEGVEVLSAARDLNLTDKSLKTALDAFKKDPERYTDLKGVYLTLSLGLEFEGFHFKLVAGVFLPPKIELEKKEISSSDKELSYIDRQKQLHPNAYAKWSQEDDSLLMEMHRQGASLNEIMTRFQRNEGSIRARLKKLLVEDSSGNWFDYYDQELARLIDLKKETESQIGALRKELLQQMEIHDEEKIKTTRFTISYSPPKTVLKFDSDLLREKNEELYRSYCTIFDSKLFREENQELYESCCKPVQKDASIVVRQNKTDEP